MRVARNRRAIRTGIAVSAVLVTASVCTVYQDGSGVDSETSTRTAPSDTSARTQRPPPAPVETTSHSVTSVPDVPPAWVQPADTYAPETTSQTPSAYPAPGTSAPSVVRPSAAPTTPKPVATTPKRATVTPRTTAPRPTKTPAKTTQKAAAPVQTTSATAAPQGNTIRIGSWSHGYVRDHGDQASLDACNLVEWSPLWFAGHNYCGYQFWASLGRGQTIVLTGRDAGVYTVVGSQYLPYQGGSKPASALGYDLVLQTCKGSGTQLVFADKTG